MLTIRFQRVRIWSQKAYYTTYVRIGMALFGPIALMAARVVAEALQSAEGDLVAGGGREALCTLRLGWWW